MLSDFNLRVILEYLPLFGAGFLSTVLLSLAALAGAMVIGVVSCAMNIQPARILRLPAVAYVDVIRATPLLAQLYFLYFGLPVLGVTLPERMIGVLALSINSGAYISEIVRSGIIAIPRGQTEAAASSGMSYWQQMRLIILPQALRPMISPLIGQIIVLVKDSSLLSLISIFELTRAGQTLAIERFLPVEGLLTTAVFYLVIYYSLKMAARAWDRANRQTAPA